MPNQKIVTIIGSTSDLPFAHRVGDYLQNQRLSITCEYRVDSAHRNPEKLLTDLKNYEKSSEQIVYITVAGLSDALSGVVAANTTHPVIACPPDLKANAWAKAFSSAMTPTGVPVMLVCEPENAALAAAKILAASNTALRKALQTHIAIMKEKVARADSELKKKEKHELEREHVERMEHLEHGEHSEEENR